MVDYGPRPAAPSVAIPIPEIVGPAGDASASASAAPPLGDPPLTRDSISSASAKVAPAVVHLVATNGSGTHQ